MLRLDRRAFLAVAATAPFAGAARAFDVPSQPPLIERDYALDRQSFRSHLLRRGPSPDDVEPLTPPAGARRLPYASGDLALTAWRSAPAKPGTGKQPAVLFLHGGNSLGSGHWLLALPYVLAGYVVMMPAVRGENGQAGAFSGFYDETDDVIAAAHVLAAQPDVDAGRLFVAGHSVGGTLSLLAAMSSPIFRGAASFSGNPSAFAFFQHFPEDIRFDASDRREFEMRSAICYATSFKCPMLLLHGEAESRLTEPSALTAGRARAAGLSAESAVVAGDHNSALPEEAIRSLAFFARLSGKVTG